MRARILEVTVGLDEAFKSDNPSVSSVERANIIFGEVPPSIFMRFLRSIRESYQYRPLDSHVVLFRRQNDFYSIHAMNGKMGWGDLFTRGMKIAETPGDRSSLLKPRSPTG